MEKEFVTYEQALALKELGFDEPCMASRDMNNGEGLIQIPLKQQAFRWFRDEHQLESVVSCFYSDKLGVLYENREYKGFIIRKGITSESVKYKTFEEAQQACLEKLCEIVEQQLKSE